MGEDRMSLNSRENVPKRPVPQLAVATRSRNIAVIGSGYEGIVLAADLASLGHVPGCTDISSERVARLLRGDVPIVEDGLGEILQDALACGRLTFGIDNVAATAHAEFVFLCLPIPQSADGQADVSAVRSVAEEIGPWLAADTAVINKSTVPVGTARLVGAALGRTDVRIVTNPEFLAEGSAVRDFFHPDRIVVGVDSVTVARQVADLCRGSQVVQTVTEHNDQWIRITVNRQDATASKVSLKVYQTKHAASCRYVRYPIDVTNVPPRLVLS